MHTNILKNVTTHEKSPMEWGTYLNLGTKFVTWSTFGITADDLYFGLFNLPFIYGNQQKMVIMMRSIDMKKKLDKDHTPKD